MATVMRIARVGARAAARPRATLSGVAAATSVRTLSTMSTTQARTAFFNPATAAAGVATIGFAAYAAYTFATPTLAQRYNGGADWAKIRKEVEDLIDSTPAEYDDGSYAPMFVRLAWHSSGTWDKCKKDGGSDGGRIRFEPESKWGGNRGLEYARSLLEPIKQRHPEITYADLFTFVGVVAVEYMSGPKISWRPGRSDEPDGSKSPAGGRLPDGDKGAKHIRDIFYRMGFNDRDIVALSGAHSVGRCHTNRSGFTGPWTRVPTSFTNEFFRELLENTWTPKKWDGPKQYEDPTGELMMLETDMALIRDPQFKIWVEKYAKDQDLFFRDFAAAFSKLLELGCNFPAVPS